MSEEEYEMSVQKYENELLKGIDELKRALKYYIERTRLLETEVKRYQQMYENRVNEYIKITDRVGGKTIE